MWFPDPWNISVFVSTCLHPNNVIISRTIITEIGLQTQSATKPVYAGPFDAMKKIYSGHGIRGIYKGQVITLWREATGYGIYFWAYEKLMQREMARKGIRRDEVNPANAVLFGAAAGYAVSQSPISRGLV